MGANAEELAAWIVKNETLKGTPQFNAVARGLEDAIQSEKLQAGQGEFANQSVLYERPQVGVGRKLAQSAGKGVAGALDLLIGAPQAVGNMYQYATNKDMPLVPYPAPIQTALTKAGVFTPEAEFNTPIGRIADVATQFSTGGGFNPMKTQRILTQKPLFDASKDIGRQVALTGTQALTAGISSEGLKDVGINNPAALAALTGVTTMAAGAPFGIRNTASDIVNKGLQGVTPEQLKMAQLLQQKAASIGSPITGAEAIAQVTGNKSLLGTQRFVENAQKSQPIMNEFMAGRPQGQRQAFQSSVEVMGLPPTSETPFNLQQAGKQVVSGANAGVTRSVTPFYQKGMSDMENVQAGKALPVLPSEVTALKANKEVGPAIQDAINHVTNDAYYKVKGLPESDPRVLNAAKIYLDTQYKNFSKTMSDSEDALKAGTAWGASRELDSYLSAKSPTYAQGSKNYEVAQKTQIGPLERGPVGQIAEGKVSGETLMPAKPVSLYPADIKRAVDLLRRKDPDVVPTWTRQQLEAVFNESAQNLQGGPNQFGGPKFAANVTGNKQQRDNLRTLVTESSGMQTWKGFEDFLDVMEAQGQRMPANSATTFNEMARQEMGGGLATKLTTPLTPSRLTKGLEQWQMGNNAQTLAKMLTDPDSVKKLEELARTGPKSAKGQILVNSLIGGYVSQKPEITEESK
jgi:hypothetical protein